VPREDDEVDLPQEVGRQAPLDDPVDQRLDVARVGRPDESVARVEALGEGLEALGGVDLGDDLDVRVQVVSILSV